MSDYAPAPAKEGYSAPMKSYESAGEKEYSSGASYRTVLDDDEDDEDMDELEDNPKGRHAYAPAMMMPQYGASGGYGGQLNFYNF